MGTPPAAVVHAVAKHVSESAPDPVAAALEARLPDIESLQRDLDAVDYLTDEGLATALFLGVRMQRPILLEGEPGVGKTEAAKSLARALDTPLIRLQCYEGITASEALYEWNYPRQLLAIRLAETRGTHLDENEMFGDAYLIRRPLLQALEHPGPFPLVLLVDEVDRSDHDFEAFLFELLSDATITIPERGTIRATCPPIVILTSNRTRELHDALKRRCLYHWIDYPSPEREVEIVRRRVPDSGHNLAVEATAAVQRLRASDIQKPPGIAEAIDWVTALRLLGKGSLDAPAAERTLGAVLKYREDEDLVRARGLRWLVGDEAGA
jgi:MoxR-like ATPase